MGAAHTEILTRFTRPCTQEPIRAGRLPWPNLDNLGRIFLYVVPCTQLHLMQGKYHALNVNIHSLTNQH